MAHTTAKAVFAAKRAHLLPLPGDDEKDMFPPPGLCQCDGDLTYTEIANNRCEVCGKSIVALPMPGEQED